MTGKRLTMQNGDVVDDCNHDPIETADGTVVCRLCGDRLEGDD